MGDVDQIWDMLTRVISALFIAHVVFTRNQRIKQAEEIATLKTTVEHHRSSMVTEERVREMIKDELHEQLTPITRTLEKLDEKLDRKFEDIDNKLAHVSIQAGILDRLASFADKKPK